LSAHYIIALPTSGIPAKITRLIKDTRRNNNELAYVNFYQAPESFRVRTGRRTDGSYRYMQTNFWVEISSEPLKVRDKPSWPMEWS